MCVCKQSFIEIGIAEFYRHISMIPVNKGALFMALGCLDCLYKQGLISYAERSYYIDKYLL